MPSLPSYIPAKEANLNSWLLNFSALLTAAPSTYGLSPTDATNVAADVSAWTAAYSPILSPSTKTAAAVSAKNSAKVSILAQIRPYAQNISLNAGVTTSAKTAIGVNPRTSVPVPITDPTLLNFIESATKSPLTATMGSGSAGTTVYFAARWQTRKGLVGPWSPIISYVVAG